MRKIVFLFFILFSIRAAAEVDTTKWLRAFPITGYMVDLKDSFKVVQVEMPDGISIPIDKIGLAYAYGVYRTEKADAVFKGYGRCHLIKNAFYYFSIKYDPAGKPLTEGDIIYFEMKQEVPIYEGRLVEIATEFTQLLDVYDNPLFDRYGIFTHWTENDEKLILDSMVSDIQFTGNYFLKENPSMNVPIKEGKYKGRNVLNAMVACELSDLNDFLDYMIAKPRMYAGNKWKISEIFATWLSKGAPIVIDN